MTRGIDPESRQAISARLQAKRDNRIVSGLESALHKDEYLAEQARQLAWESRYKDLEERISFVLKKAGCYQTRGVITNGVIVEKQRIANPVTIDLEGLPLTATWAQDMIKPNRIFARTEVERNRMNLAFVNPEDPTITLLAGRAALSRSEVNVPYHYYLGIDDSLPYVVEPGRSYGNNYGMMHVLAYTSIEPVLAATERALVISIN